MVTRVSAATALLLLMALWNFQGPRVVEGAFRSTQEPDAQAKEKQAKGMEAFGKTCVQCHALRLVTIQRKTADKWRDTVYGMIGRGAQVKPDEIEPITSYLVASFGPQVPLQASEGDAGANRSQAPAAALPDGNGRAVVMERCSACHAVDVIAKSRLSKDQWVEKIGKMRGLGAVLSADEEKAAIAYLAEHLGPPAR